MEVKQEMTPAEHAELALKDRSVFCKVLADARQYKAPGWWDGSAFRCHPCGIIDGTIKMTNHWHCDDLGDIKITDGEGWNRSVSQDSFGHGSPHPAPIGGRGITVWDCSRWASPEYEEALKPRILEILIAAITHIERAKSEKKEIERRAHEAAQLSFEQAKIAALARATQSS
jgi:hypothetical protein